MNVWNLDVKTCFSLLQCIWIFISTVQGSKGQKLSSWSPFSHGNFSIFDAFFHFIDKNHLLWGNLNQTFSKPELRLIGPPTYVPRDCLQHDQRTVTESAAKWTLWFRGDRIVGILVLTYINCNWLCCSLVLILVVVGMFSKSTILDHR